MEANYSIRSRRIGMLVILLAVLLHLIFFIALLLIQYKDQARELMLQAQREKAAQLLKQQKQAQKKDDESIEWFSGDARPSPAPVIFHEEPAAPPAKDFAQETESVKQSLLESEVVQEKQSQETTNEKDEEASPLDQKNKETIEHTTLIAQAAVSQQKKSDSNQIKKEAERVSVKKKVAQTKADETKIPEKQSTQAQKKLSLADIAQGLMSKFDQNSQHYVTSKGGNLGQPTQEQLKYERYVAKLFACMQKSISLHKSRFNMEAYHESEVYFQLTLNRNGSLVDVHIISSSGSRALDDFILFVVQDAASAFPPVPSFLKHTSYPLGFIINPGPNKSSINFSYS